MPDRLTDIKGPSATSPERFDNDRTDPRARPNPAEPSPEVEPKPNQEYSRNDYNDPDPTQQAERRASGCTARDEHGNCYRDGCPVHAK